MRTRRSIKSSRSSSASAACGVEKIKVHLLCMLESSRVTRDNSAPVIACLCCSWRSEFGAGLICGEFAAELQLRIHLQSRKPITAQHRRFDGYEIQTEASRRSEWRCSMTFDSLIEPDRRLPRTHVDPSPAEGRSIATKEGESAPLLQSRRSKASRREEHSLVPLCCITPTWSQIHEKSPGCTEVEWSHACAFKLASTNASSPSQLCPLFADRLT